MQIPPLITDQREAIAGLCRRSSARKLDLFGSALRDDFDPERSDLDFLVEFDDVPPTALYESYFSLKEALELLFRRHVDLVVERAIRNPYFKAAVERDRRPVYAS